MGRIRSKLTYANVMATLAVFLVLGGGSAVALSGQNTVQSDDIGPGAQVKAADVAANAVSGGKVADNSLTGADVNETTLNGVIRGRTLDLNMDIDDPVTPIATVGPYLISGECFLTSAGSQMRIDAKGPAGLAEAELSVVDNDTTDKGNISQSATLPANVNTRVVAIYAHSATFTRGGGTMVLRTNSGKIVQVDFSAVVDTNADACHVWGTATTG
jgi:hypothetical protein